MLATVFGSKPEFELFAAVIAVEAAPNKKLVVVIQRPLSVGSLVQLGFLNVPKQMATEASKTYFGDRYLSSKVYALVKQPSCGAKWQSERISSQVHFVAPS